ncbi:MAG: hypothetical protein H5U40_09120, partial [Polyangiaceae bacterium]|nr:hypothetical protein [Polyangiaceae bacterium]
LILTSTALGTVFEPNSPLLQGVPEDLALEYTCDAPLLTGARAIANWETGRPVAAVRSVNDSSRVDLNIFVGQGAVGNIAVPGVVTLIANALRYPLK